MGKNFNILIINQVATSEGSDITNASSQQLHFFPQSLFSCDQYNGGLTRHADVGKTRFLGQVLQKNMGILQCVPQCAPRPSTMLLLIFVSGQWPLPRPKEVCSKQYKWFTMPKYATCEEFYAIPDHQSHYSDSVFMANY